MLIIHKIINFILNLIYELPYKKNLILFQSHDLYSYNDNSKYLYEYLSKKKYQCIWITRSESLISYLNNKKFKYFKFDKNIFNIVFLLLRTKIIFDSGTSFFSPLDLNIYKITKINIGHGVGPKINFHDTGSNKKNIINIVKLNQFNFFNFTSNYSKVHLSKSQNIFGSKKIVLGYPRLDISVNKDNLLNSLSSFNSIIVYTPTWRSYKSDLPIKYLKNFEFKKFNSFLIKNNFCFVYSIHPQFQFIKEESLNAYSNLINFEKIKNFEIDINHLLKYCSLLINDYSTTSTDAAVYGIPQIYLYSDYERFIESNGFVEDYKSINPGPEVKDYDQFIKFIMTYIKNPNIYFEGNKLKIEQYLNHYYDFHLQHYMLK